MSSTRERNCHSVSTSTNLSISGRSRRALQGVKKKRSPTSKIDC